MDDKKIELHDIDLISYIAEAKRRAMQEGIKANSIMINERLIKTKPFIRQLFNSVITQIPPMICGLEARITDELPDEYAFAVLESPNCGSKKTESREKRLRRELWNALYDYVNGSYRVYVCAEICPKAKLHDIIECTKCDSYSLTRKLYNLKLQKLEEEK